MQCVGTQDIDYGPGAIGGEQSYIVTSYHILEPGQTLDNSTLSQHKKKFLLKYRFQCWKEKCKNTPKLVIKLSIKH